VAAEENKQGQFWALAAAEIRGRGLAAGVMNHHPTAIGLVF
jgi:hypothetical protein